jgi:hypothetical protein
MSGDIAIGPRRMRLVALLLGVAVMAYLLQQVKHAMYSLQIVLSSVEAMIPGQVGSYTITIRYSVSLIFVTLAICL